MELSFPHDFLLDGMLALSAIHKAVRQPQHSSSLMLRSSMYIERAITSFRSHLDQPSAATTVPVFALASLLAIHSLAIAQVQPPSDPLHALCFMARLFKGIGATIRNYWNHLLESDITPLLVFVDKESLTAEELPELVRLRDWVAQMQNLDHHLREACLDAIDELHFILRHIRSLEHGDRAPVAITLNLPAMLPSVFLDHLAEKHEVTLVILAHFAIPCSMHEDTWFLRNWARWTFQEDQEVDERLGAEYESYIEWPREMMRTTVS